MTRALGLTTAAALLAGCGHAPAPDPAAAQGSYQAEIVPLLARYCYRCHGGGKRKGDVALDRYRDEGAALGEARTWELVLERVESHDMPPEGEPQPSPAERERLAGWVASSLLARQCDGAAPRPVTLRRLNRAEYDNTIRDLLGIDLPLARDFPVDNSGFGFDTVADALSISPALAEKLLSAVDRALDAALPGPELTRPRRQRFPVDLLEIGYNAIQRGDGWVLLHSFEEDDVTATHDVLFAAEYAVRVRAYAQQDVPAVGNGAKYARADGHRPVDLTLMIDDQVAGAVRVAATADAPAIHQIRLRAPAGRHRFRAVVRRDKQGLLPSEAARWKTGGQQKGWVALEYLELEGPLGGEGRPPPGSHRRIFAQAARGADPRAAAAAVLAAFARRAYRRPLAQGEADALVEIAAGAWRRGEGFEEGVRAGLKAALVSPQFLFRTETGEHALASRLSYFLWSTMPDAQLFAEAEQGTLRRNLDGQVRRMLADRKARAFVENFVGQWLQLRNLDDVAPDGRRFPRWNEALRADMRRETDLFFETVAREDRSVLELLGAEWTLVNERLARHYELEGVRGDDFRRVSLAGTPRLGILTHASVLTLTSNPTRTSPVKRGKWVLEALLGTPPPPPPPDVPQLDDDKVVAGSLRQRLEAHRQDPVCASCHARMDPLGFGLEGFDAIGAHRASDGGRPIDASGKLVSGESFDGARALAGILAERKREPFVRALAAKMLTYAIGRGLEPSDRCALERIGREVAGAGHRFSSLVLAVARSAPFVSLATAEAR